jgi:hypothetical protein
MCFTCSACDVRVSDLLHRMQQTFVYVTSRLVCIVQPTGDIVCPLTGSIRYMVVDCGGGTVDITVHELDTATGRLQELHKAAGGPHGSCG